MPALLFGQTKQHPWNIGVHFGNEQWNGDIGDASYNFTKAFYMFGGITVGRYISPSFDGVLTLNAGEIGYWNNGDSILYENKKFGGNFYGNHYNGYAVMRYKFNNGYILKENARIAPYAFIGLGFSWMYGSRIYYEYNGKIVSGGYGQDLTVPTGVGVSVRIKDRIHAYLQTAFMYSDHDTRDGINIRNNDGFVLNQIGVTYDFGKAFKPVAAVAAVECRCEIFDRDSDGIIDRMDMCPDVPGTLQARGCPDRDWDGIPDTLDKCPDVYGIPKFEGCPDTDGDGIPDHKDSCVTVPGPAAFNGCPDADKDGIPDHLDECPTVKGLPKFKGCPDTDGDSLPDHLDKCPKEPGPVRNQGCPEIKESVRKVFEQALTGIQFEVNKAVILPKSFGILDNVVKVAKENPTYYLIINGHTDDQGDDAKNLKLSEDRANAVRLYLMKKGVSAGRMESHGYGESQPIETNTTPEGRSKNRRVEFKVRIM